MRPLVVLVLVEFAILALLAAQWLGLTAVVAKERATPPAGPPPAGRIDAATAPLAKQETARIDEATTPDASRSPDAGIVRQAADASGAAQVAANDALGILLTGTIRGSDGALVENANVYLRREAVGRSSNSAAPGVYAVAGLQPGEWTLTCRADGFGPHEQVCVLDSRAFQQVDIELQRSIVVRVKIQGADGKSIAEELQRKTIWGMPYVVATETPLAGDLPPTTQSRLLRFGVAEWRSYDGRGGEAQPKLLEQGYCGELRLNRPPPVCVSLLLRTVLLQSQRLEPGQSELVFTIEVKDVLGRHGTVTMRVIDESGNPIPGLKPNVRTAQGGGRGGGTTGADGKAVIEGVAPGLGILNCFSGAEREQLNRFVRVPAGGVVDLGDIVMTAAEKVAGSVVDAGGKPVNGATVQWTELDGRTFPQPLVQNRSASSDADGKFQLPCGRHRYVVSASTREGGYGFATVDARAGAPGPVTIALGKRTSVALNANFAPTVGYCVTALASDRSPVAVAMLGAEMRAKSISLLPGAYTIEIHDMLTDRLARSFALQVGAEPLTIDVP